MDLTAFAGLGLAAGALGGAAAGLAGPVACTWPSLTSASLVLRVQRLADRLPSRHRRIGGGLALTLILFIAGATAYAAYPAAPARLVGLARAAEAGLRSALWVAPGPAAPIVQPPASPAAAPDQSSDRATPVDFGRIPDEATIDHYFALAEVRHGPDYLTAEDKKDDLKRRLMAYQMMIEEEIDRRQAEIDAGERAGTAELRTWWDIEAFLGKAAYADYNALSNHAVSAIYARVAEGVKERPITGPSSFYLPKGSSVNAAMAAAGVDGRGVWSQGPVDAQGGHVMTRTAPYQTWPRPAGGTWQPGYSPYPGPEPGVRPPAPDRPGNTAPAVTLPDESAPASPAP